MFGLTFRKETEEERWLRKALDGDNTATEWIYRRHVRYLSALCSRYITEDEDIKDVLQESFIKIFTFLDSFKYRGEGSLKAWMAKIGAGGILRGLPPRPNLPHTFFYKELAKYKSHLESISKREQVTGPNAFV